MLSIKDLCKAYISTEGNHKVLNNLNLDVSQGDSLALIGESGSGKSTLLNIIAGLEKPSSGTIWVDGIELWSIKEFERAKIRREKMAVIFQQFNLIPSLKIKQNIEFHARLNRNIDIKFINDVIFTLGLEDILEKYPEQTSGGQQQRVAIARAISSKPNLILADEPTGNLDEENTLKVAKLLNSLVKKNNMTLIVATHSQNLAATLDSKVVLIKGHLQKNAR
jgi:putative ABC transport system ATP-binding protein